MKRVKVVIGVPSGESWSAKFGMDLTFLTNYLASHYELFDKAVISFVVMNPRGSILAASRERVIKTAIQQQATHVLFIDSDQTFPKDLFHRLYKHKKHVVAANIATKMIPPSMTARIKDADHPAGKPLYTGEDSTGLVEVWRVGTGVMLIDLNVFKRKGMEQPWFEQKWNPELEDYTGEDWAFLDKIEASGAKIYVDQDVSKEIGHVGPLKYIYDMVIEEFL